MSTRRQAIASIQGTFNQMQSLMGQFSEFAEQMTGLSAPKLLVLRVVEHGAVKVGDVARAAMTHVSTASRLVDQLVEDGLLTRTEDPNDRRAVVLARTSAGDELVANLQDKGAELMDAGLADWTVGDLGAFADQLARFSQAITASVDHVGKTVTAGRN